MKSGKWILFVVLIFCLSACSSFARPDPSNQLAAEPTLTYTDYYDLGFRYLSEGNYEEAIIAFTAAIEIDPKQAPAYVGRGDSYTGVAQLAAAAVGVPEELPQNAKDAYESAIQDYLASLELAPNDPEVYLKTADAYVALGGTDAALDILNRGLAATGDQTIQERIDGLERPEGASETVSVRGTIIHNSDTYHEPWKSYIRQYENEGGGVRCAINAFGVRFEVPVTVYMGGKTVSIQEARFHPNDEININNQMYDYSTETVGPLIGQILEMTGHFILNSQTQELEGPIEREDGYTYYYYRPNGDYCFVLESYTVP